MIYKTVDSLPFSFSALGLHTWSDESGDRSSAPVDSNELIAAVQTALELGMTYLEVFSSRATAPSAEVISKALQGRRDGVVLAGICGADAGVGIEDRLTRRDQIIAACETGLRVLRTERFDLFYCRWPDVSAPLPEVAGAFDHLLNRGEIGAAGLSHYGYEQISALRRSGPLHAVRSAINLLHPEDADDLIPYCKEHGIAVVAADPLSNDFLAAEARESEIVRPPGSIKVMQGRRFEADRWAAERLRSIANELHRTPAQLAINWVLGTAGVTTAATRAGRSSQVREHLGALGWTIPDATVARIVDTLSERDRQLDR